MLLSWSFKMTPLMWRFMRNQWGVVSWKALKLLNGPHLFHAVVFGDWSGRSLCMRRQIASPASFSEFYVGFCFFQWASSPRLLVRRPEWHDRVRGSQIRGVSLESDVWNCKWTVTFINPEMSTLSHGPEGITTVLIAYLPPHYPLLSFV